MISDRTYRAILDNCNFTEDTASNKCDDAVTYAMNHEFGDIDQYSIYTPSCMQLPNSTVRLKNTLLRRRVSGYDPCTEKYAEKYYNRPEVQKAMHANVTGIPYKWTACRYILVPLPTLYFLQLKKKENTKEMILCFFFDLHDKICYLAAMFLLKTGRILNLLCYPYTRI